MKLFTCSVCGQPLFFENVKCTRCGRVLCFLPDLGVLTPVEPAGDGRELHGVFTALIPSAERGQVRLCRNYVEHAACNWAIPAEDDGPYCRACRLNEVVPNLSNAHAKEAWQRVERAKRRLIYTLNELGLDVKSKVEQPDGGLAFSFMEEVGGAKVTTGHRRGLITLNLAEADDPFREKIREQMGEAYRTLLGHFRHEIGHYYWDRLVRESPSLEAFRAEFGDERADYSEATKRHYESGPPSDWSAKFVSAYASMHPWEDWAESWAHYLHMVDTLGTARSYGVVLRPEPVGRESVVSALRVSTRRLDFNDFDDLVAGWVPLTVALNSLNRSMGLKDVYPFVLSAMAIRKLRFVHDLIERGAVR